MHTPEARSSSRHWLEDHALARAAERYGLSLTRRDLAAISDRISRGRAFELGRDEWLLCYRGTLVVVVYNRRLDTVATFLTVEMTA